MALVQIHQEDYDALQNEVVTLRRKFKYIQGISTVFRQKIAFIVRELGAKHGAGADLQHVYKAAIGELGGLDTELRSIVDEFRNDSAETTMGGRRDGSGSAGGAGGARLEPAQASAFESGLSGAHPLSGGMSDADDVHKAYHLCTILDEKNEWKAKEAQRAAELHEAHLKIQELSNCFRQVLEAIQRDGGASAQHMAAVYEDKLAALTKELSIAKEHRFDEPSKLSTYLDRLGDLSAITPSGKTPAGDEGESPALHRRIQYLKEEVKNVRNRASASAQEFGEYVDVFNGRVREMNREIAGRDTRIAELLEHDKERRREIEDLQKQLSRHLDQLDALNQEHQCLLRAFNALQHCSAAENQELANAVAEYGKVVSKKDEQLAEAGRKLTAEQEQQRERDLKLRALSAQLESAQSQVTTLMAQVDQERQQHASITAIGERLLNAVADVRRFHGGGDAAGHLNQLHGRMSNLEGLEMQLRTKDDELAMAHDEIDRLRASHAELHKALHSLTALFASMPGSTGDLERLVLEFEECRNELRRCAAEHRVPDLATVEGKIDLRILEAKHRKQNVLMRRGEGVPALSSSANPYKAGEAASPSRGVAEEGTSFQASPAAHRNGDRVDLSNVMNIPPIPSLINITSSVSAPLADPNVSHISGSVRSPADSPPRVRVSDSTAPVETTFQRDVAAAFELFATREPTTNQSILTPNAARLCLSTLNLPEDAARALDDGELITLSKFMTLCQGIS